MSRANGGRNYPPADYYEEREREYNPGPRRRPRDYEEIDIDITRAPGRSAPDFVREDYGRPSPGQLVVRERSRGPSHGRYDEHESEEEVLIKQRRPRRSRDRPRGEDREEIDIDIRREERPRPRARDSGREEIDIDIRREERPRRRREVREEVDINICEESPPPARPREYDEEIIIRRGEGGSRIRPREVDRQEIVIREKEKEVEMPCMPRPRRREREVEEVEIDIRRDDPPEPRPRRRAREIEKEEVDIKIRQGSEEGRPITRDTIVLRERSVGPRPVRREREEFIYRRREPSPSPEREIEEIIIRQRVSRSPSPPPAPEPPCPEPEPVLVPITRPPIIQEIITHHRHIDHGFVRAPRSESSSSSSSSSPSPPPPPRRKKEAQLEIDIRRKDARGNVFQEDIKVVESDSRSERSSRRELSARREAEDERKIVVRQAPPRVFREKTNINIDLELVPPPSERRLVVPGPPPKPRPKEMWTEVTKDLVSREAIEKAGYEFEETDEFYYVLEFLRYEDVEELVQITEDLTRNRRERIEEIQWERKDPRLSKRSKRPEPCSPPSGYEERIYEREVIYEDRPPPPRRYR